MSVTDPQSITDLQRERERLGLDPVTAREREGDELSIAERVATANEGVPYEEEYEQEEPEAEPGELFVLQQGRRVPLSRMVNQGTPIEYAINLNSKSVQGGADMGLLSYGDPNIILIVPARQGKVVVDPTYDDDGYVSKVTIRANFKPQSIHDAASPEGRALLGIEQV